MLTRTSEEIRAYIEAKPDVLGSTLQTLVPYLSFDNVRSLLKDEATEDWWNEAPDPDATRPAHDWDYPSWAGNSLGTPRPFTREAVLLEAEAYHRFACVKARDQRGISAGRSVLKLTAWAWLLGEDDMVGFAEDDDNYPAYGAPILKRFAEHFGWPWPNDADLATMARGEMPEEAA